MRTKVTAVCVALAGIVGTTAQTRPMLTHAEDAARWVVAQPATPDNSLYAGAPGLVLFMLELHHATGKPAYLDEAKRRADVLMAVLGTEKQTGLYTGVAGVGFTLGEVYRATKEEKYRDGVRDAVRVLGEREWGPVTDIIGGTAGTGLFMLHAGRLLGDPGATQAAARAADRLIQQGISEHSGLKWQMAPNAPRVMPNFSHGTAGIAYFLARVYEETKEKKYLDASLAGAKYLQAIAKTEGDMCLIRHNEPDGLDLYYLGWCHGPVGTARLWYQLAKVTGNRQWLTWVDKSARALLASGIPETRTPGFWNNVSQCCGSAGVGQFFLDLHGVKANPAYLQFAKRMTDDLLKRGTRDEKGLRWVQAEHRVRPEQLAAQTGYMQGASGIGMWLLRLDAAETRRPNFVRFPDTPF